MFCANSAAGVEGTSVGALAIVAQRREIEGLKRGALQICLPRMAPCGLFMQGMPTAEFRKQVGSDTVHQTTALTEVIIIG